MKNPQKKWYSRLPAKRLDQTVEPFDREIDSESLKPLTPRMRLEERAARRRGRGRPRIGQGAARVLLSMERGLLEELDRHARKAKMTRAAFIAQAVRAELRRCG